MTLPAVAAQRGIDEYTYLERAAKQRVPRRPRRIHCPCS